MAITFVASDVDGGNASTLTGLTWPTVQAGDLALLVWTGVSTTTWTDPSGWTLVAEHNGGSGSLRSRLYYRVCTGSESGSITLTHADVNRQSAVLAVYRGAHPTSPIDAWADRDEDTATDTHACPQVTTGHADCVIVTAVGERVTGGTTDYTPPTGYTERADTDALASGTGGTITALADDGLATSRPSGTSVTPPPWIGAVSTGNVVTWTISVRPDAPSTLGPAAETDTALPVAHTKNAAAGPAAETDTALPVAHTKNAAAGPAAETDTALPVAVGTAPGGTLLPKLIVEVAFSSAPSTISSYLTLNDPTRGLIDTGKIAPDNLGGAEVPIWEDVSQWVRSVAIRRGSSRIDSPVVRYEPGTCSVVLSNADRRFDPSNTDGPYVDGDGVSQVRPMRAVRIRAQWDNQIYPLFYGYADAWDVEWREPSDSVCTLTATDAFKVLANIKRIPQTPAGAGETTSARINRILNSAAWPATDRMIGTGTVTVQATTLEGSALDELWLTSDTEIGELYVDGAGRVRFRGRSQITGDTRSATSQATFGDGGGSELPYQDLTIATDHETVYNHARITRVGGTEQTALDLVSVTEYFERVFERSDLIMTTDEQALTYAQYIVLVAATAELRFTQITIDPRSAPNQLYPQVLGRECGDRITIRKRPPGGGLVERDVWIRGMEHEIEPERWRTTWTLQAAYSI